ncbi:polyhomeotic distal isoform a-related [Anaeramoeba flamelloides]|uniref:Polyhomeotic distal isoform a-related n=1 Tax=Anaeramoeba flamelloides TaxID=1746091 RepID=A0AAV7ZK72_9EUKA|nr:polyhomeotic distal isoform a-related [Anaeramoeba flamelloides]
MFEKSLKTKNQKQLHKYLIQISIILEQIGVLVKPILPYSLIKCPTLETFECFLNPNWKRTFEIINGRSPSTDQNNNKRTKPQTREEKTIGMLTFRSVHQLVLGPKTRDQISKNTKFAKQRICVVLSIFKGIGLVKENSNKKRSLFLNVSQIDVIPNTLEQNKKVIELRRRRRNLRNKGIILLNQLQSRLNENNANFDDLKKFEEKKKLLLKSILSKTEKYETKIETNNNPTVEFLKNIQKPTNGTIEIIQKILHNKNQSKVDLKKKIKTRSKKSHIKYKLRYPNKYKLKSRSQSQSQKLPPKPQQVQNQTQGHAETRKQIFHHQQQQKQQQQWQPPQQKQSPIQKNPKTPFQTNFQNQTNSQFQQKFQSNQQLKEQKYKPLSQDNTSLQYNSEMYPRQQLLNTSSVSKIRPKIIENKLKMAPKVQDLEKNKTIQTNSILKKATERSKGKEKEKGREKEKEIKKESEGSRGDGMDIYTMKLKPNLPSINRIRKSTPIFAQGSQNIDEKNRITPTTLPSFQNYPQFDFANFLYSVSPISRSPTTTLFEDDVNRASPWTYDQFLNSERTRKSSETEEFRKSVKSESPYSMNFYGQSPYLPTLRFSPYFFQQDSSNTFQQSVSPLRLFNPELFDKVQKEISETQKIIQQQIQQQLQQQQQQQQQILQQQQNQHPQQQIQLNPFFFLKNPQTQQEHKQKHNHTHTQMQQQIQQQQKQQQQQQLYFQQYKQHPQFQSQEKTVILEKNRATKQNKDPNEVDKIMKPYEIENNQESRVQPKFIPKISEDWFK